MSTIAHSTLRAAGLGTRAPVVVDDFVLIPFLLSDTTLVALLQDAFARRLAREMVLRALRPPIELPEVRIHMYWNARNTREPSVAWLWKALVATAQDLQREQAAG